MAMKYQPYHGYGSNPDLWYPLIGGEASVRRVRTRSGYCYNYPAFDWLDGDPCAFWRRPSDSNGPRYEKQRAHRVFRRHAKAAIARELAGESVSHAFRYYGDWLD